MNTDDVIPFGLDEQPGERECDRFKAIHTDHLPQDQLASDMGTPEEWLGTAISHLKVQDCEARRQGATVATVSTAALGLLMCDWEARAVGGKPWGGNAA
jgi:hypothetical protein